MPKSIELTLWDREKRAEGGKKTINFAQVKQVVDRKWKQKNGSHVDGARLVMESSSMPDVHVKESVAEIKEKGIDVTEDGVPVAAESKPSNAAPASQA